MALRAEQEVVTQKQAATTALIASIGQEKAVVDEAEGEGEVVKEAIAMAKVIAEKSQFAVQACKEAVNAGASRVHMPCAFRLFAARLIDVR